MHRLARRNSRKNWRKNSVTGPMKYAGDWVSKRSRRPTAESFRRQTTRQVRRVQLADSGTAHEKAGPSLGLGERASCLRHCGLATLQITTSRSGLTSHEGTIMLSRIHCILIIGRILVVTAFVSSILSLPIPTAHAAELHAEVTISIREAVAEVATVFEKRSGHKVKTTVAAPGEIVATLQAGRQADVVVVTNGALAELEDKGLVRRGGVPLASAGFGLATRSGDHVPDISTPEALRAVLLEASKVILNDPNVAPAGQLLLHIAERLGVADQVKAKSQVVAAGTNVSTLAKDTSPGIVIALSVLPEIAGHPGAKLLGPLPRELQAPVTVFAALGARPQEEAAAQAFLQELGSTEAKKAYAAIGFEVE